MWNERLKAMKKESGMTTSEIASKSGIPEPTLEKLFAGATRDPKLETMKQLVHFLGFSLDDLYESSAVEKKAPPILDEADEIARQYRKLDSHGKGAVKAVLDFESAAVIAEARQSAAPGRPTLKLVKRSDGFLETKVYDQPSAAGFGNYLDDPSYHIEQYPANVVPDGTEFGVRISGDSMAPDIRDGGTVFVQSRATIEPGQIGIFVLNGEAFCKKLVVDRAKGQVRLSSLNPAYKDRIIEECDDFRTVGLVLGQWSR